MSIHQVVLLAKFCSNICNFATVGQITGKRKRLQVETILRAVKFQFDSASFQKERRSEWKIFLEDWEVWRVDNYRGKFIPDNELLQCQTQTHQTFLVLFWALPAC